MTFQFIYENDNQRIMYATYIDARASIPQIKNRIGFEIKDYIDTQIETLNDQSITYKIETDLGVMAGFFSIQVDTSNKTAILALKVLRPAFTEFDTDIMGNITNFIMLGQWRQDYLFDN